MRSAILRIGVSRCWVRTFVVWLAAGIALAATGESPAPSGQNVAGVEQLSEQELGQTLGSLQQHYQVLRTAFQRVALYNEFYCEEAARLAAACPLTLPISAGFLQEGICGADGFGPHPVRATVPGQGRWKLLINGVYESSGFSGENQQITFVNMGASPVVDTSEHVEFLVPFKDIKTMELIPQGETTTSHNPSLTLRAGAQVIVEAVSFDAAAGAGGSPVWRADLGQLQQDAQWPACHPVFEEIQARVTERVQERLRHLEP